ncbi:gluconate 2-dehydrogenase subunit 3 family protein [Olivibacter ginsenosidimutans]|uniref:Gluconate 2-dehydrogenase subunit 3 family protein n=1 Tax=Olivibacter ginsenosidimutans TaxID=1176537 RepID=A0ABP9AFW6_9SPHI
MNRRKALKIGVGLTSIATLGATIKPWFTKNLPLDSRVFSDMKDLLAELAETIIPETDTPGAKLAGVADYLLLVINDCFTIKEQRIFYQGLTVVEKMAVEKFGQSFVCCDAKIREELLTILENDDGHYQGLLYKIKRKLWGRSFLDLLKEHVVEGYCTSEAGATKGLAYQAIPMKYEGCITIGPDQKAWATR